jgi:hypothetical protein
MSNLLLEVGYMGSNAIHGQRRVDDNQPRLDNPGELTSINSRKPYPALSWMIANEHSSDMNYQAGFMRVERRFEKGFTFISSYTFSKLLDDYGMINDQTAFWPQNTYDKKAEKGHSALDTRHRFTTGYVWEIPFGLGRSFGTNINPVLNTVIGGWQIAGDTTMQTGTPGGLLTFQDWSNTGHFQERPDQVHPIHYLNIRKSGGYWFSSDTFAHPAFGSFGNARRGCVNTPGMDNWDIAPSKSFQMTERAKITFRAEMYNAFNHTQFLTYYGGIDPSVTNLGWSNFKHARITNNADGTASGFLTTC